MTNRPTIAERLTEEIAEPWASRAFGYVAAYVAAEAVRRTITLAADRVGKMAPTLVMNDVEEAKQEALREAEQMLRKLADEKAQP